MSYFIYIAWSYDGIFWVFLLSLISFALPFQVALSDFFAVFFLLFSSLHIPVLYFSFFSTFDSCCSFSNFPSSLILHLGFVFMFGVLSGTRVIYWPSTEPSIKRCTCVNKRKNSGGSWTLENNITRCPGGSRQLETRCWTSCRLRALGP